MQTLESFPIAVVGIAVELPSGAWSAENLDLLSFSRFLFEKAESYEHIPKERFNIEHIQGDALGNVIPDTGSFLRDLSQFDYMEFGITGRDARLLPVSTRKLIECTFLSLLDSGIDYRGRNIGCYTSGVAHDLFSVSGHNDADARASLAYAPSTLANKVSYHLDLRGPSIPVDTACSSSLHATHLAIQALRNSECEAAVVGGSQINHRFAEWLTYSQVSGVLSPDGKCKPFDASANGFSRSEGVVSIVLKPLHAALLDGDKIYCSILGTGVNSCGAQAPVNAPVAESQREAMRRAFRMARRSPQDVDFIELHATGTKKGDPTEANWIGAECSRDDELLVGSVKGNIGHLEITAFLGSLAKVCCIFNTGMIPPNVNFKNPNEGIKWNEYRLRVPTEPEPLKCRSSSGRSLIAMTSSGIGGANGHCVVEGPPALDKREKTFWRVEMSLIPAVLIAGGLSPRSAKAIGDSLRDAYTDDDRHQISRLYSRRARSMPWRSFAIAKGGKVSQFQEPVLSHRSSVPLVFVYSGQGPQYFDKDPHEDVLGEVWPIAITLPALAMVQIALFDTLVSLAIKPDAVIGHSAGETAMIYASGAGSKALALELAIARGRAMSALEDADGAMAAVNCSVDQVRDIIATVIAEAGFGPLEIGCYNTPEAVTLSGKASHINLAVQVAEGRGFFARRLRTKIPVHSAMMDLCQSEYQRLVQDVFARYTVQAPSIDVYSAESGEAFTKIFDAQYFWDNTRGSVRFAEAVKALQFKYSTAIFVELGPHPVLSGYVSSMVGKDSPVLCPLRRPKKGQPAVELQGLVEFVGKLVVSGYHSVDFNVLSACDQEGQVTPLPYPFARRDVPYVAATPEITRQRQNRNGPLNYPQLQVNVNTHPALAEHVIKGEPIMPAAGYLEMYDRLHAKGYLSMETPALSPTPIDLEHVLARLNAIDMKNFYDGFASFAQYGPMYQRVTACYRGVDTQGREEVLVEVRGNDGDIPDLDGYHLHPAILDGALHVMVHPILTCCWDSARYYLPAKVGAFTVHDALFKKPFPKVVFAHGTMSAWSPEAIIYNFTIVRKDGVPLCTFESFEVARHGYIPETVERRFEVVDVHMGLVLPRQIANGHGPRVNGIKENDHTPEVEGATVNGNGNANGDAKPRIDGGISICSRQHENTVIIDYGRGVEMHIQELLSKMDTLAPVRLWLRASAGLDGDALLGFSRSLRKEYGAWSVRAAVFPASWSEEDKATAMKHLLSSECEDEIYVQEDGTVTVPRIMPSVPPAASAPFHPESPWVYDGVLVRQVSTPRVPPDHIQIDITGVSQVSKALYSFLGTTAGESREVVGIAVGPISNVAVVHLGSIVDVKAFSGANNVPAFALAAAVLGVGYSNFAHPDRIRDTSAFVTHAETAVGRSIAAIYETLGLEVLSCSGRPTVSDLKTIAVRRPTFILSGCEDASDIQVFDDHVSPKGKVFLWSDAKRGVPGALSSDPWAVGDAIKLALAKYPHAKTSFKAPVKMIRGALPKEVPLDIAILSQDKTYLLIGGIGSLGLEIALWMYSQGARSIVMTSRGGRASILKRGSALSKRIMKHLDGLLDLKLHAVAADAVSLKDIRRVVSAIDKPLGGCMILSAALIDRTFHAQTAETFEAPFPPKVGAFQVLEQAVDVDSLDFFVTVSSVSAMFGNAGQTNYASANTALAGLTKKYKNAFCMVCPAIIDSAIALKGDADSVYRRRLRHLTDWGMSASELCTYLGDGIRKLRDGTVWQYVPNFDWPRVAANMGVSAVFKHLLPESNIATARESQGTSDLKDIICKILEVAPNDLVPDVPLTAYGLDSLSATSLSTALASLVAISQIQLLADVTFQQLEAAAEEAKSSSFVSTQTEATEFGEIDEMLHMVEQFGSDFHSVQPESDEAPASTGWVIVITGTRGSLGTHMLARLLLSSNVSKIHSTATHSSLPDPRVSVGPGYSKSKWVSERLLDVAMSKIPGFSATTIRIHQLAGGLNGSWKPSEWFPALVSASVALGCFPDGRDSISWIPVDMAAAAMVDFLTCRDAVLHLRHPKPILWRVMANSLARIIDVPVVPYAEWLARLEHELKAQGIRQISPYLAPAMRLMDVYRSPRSDDHPAQPMTESNGLFPALSIGKAIEASPTLRDPDLPEIQEDEIAAWVRYWRQMDALPGN
ncbi:polyketide synthase [Gloeophyllum trabeum ATCC 11539]|uniref:Polyketide synthase n=1 Tax=Gloeophyllum trabeum (strain ATCC 11539 / FP-39264 / Madison 617) TaxID=670483 RepID=S7QEV2_GLOTA|nr:polyketide synthase [Gloeophyllum trabeum ATCC 11539]EPQ57833.1 polyketide synthase [Gloeophyllum trabeum ATCC 11539]